MKRSLRGNLIFAGMAIYTTVLAACGPVKPNPTIPQPTETISPELSLAEIALRNVFADPENLQVEGSFVPDSFQFNTKEEVIFYNSTYPQVKFYVQTGELPKLTGVNNIEVIPQYNNVFGIASPDGNILIIGDRGEVIAEIPQIEAYSPEEP